MYSHKSQLYMSSELIRMCTTDTGKIYLKYILNKTNRCHDDRQVYVIISVCKSQKANM